MRDIEDLIEKLHPRLPGHIKCFMYELVERERLRCAGLAESGVWDEEAKEWESSDLIAAAIRKGD